MSGKIERISNWLKSGRATKADAISNDPAAFYIGKDIHSDQKHELDPSSMSNHIAVVAEDRPRFAALTRIFESGIETGKPMVVCLPHDRREFYMKAYSIARSRDVADRIKLVDFQFDSMKRYYSDIGTLSVEELVDFYSDFDACNVKLKDFLAWSLPLMSYAPGYTDMVKTPIHLCLFISYMKSHWKEAKNWGAPQDLVEVWEKEMEVITRYKDRPWRLFDAFEVALSKVASAAIRYPDIFSHEYHSISMKNVIENNDILFVILPEARPVIGTVVFSDFYRETYRSNANALGIFEEVGRYLPTRFDDRLKSISETGRSVVVATGSRKIYSNGLENAATISQASSADSIFNFFDGKQNVLIDVTK